ncbi:MAG: segregation/condensation protein A [Planctomycetota bacterium]|nr:segregation/condensation protein A [Planctomycetota bacterium]
MTLTEYRIDTGLFTGPLDLLLYLVRKTEIDVCAVSLAKITRDFVAYIEVLAFLDFDLIGDFVVVASTLLEIKSNEILPTQIAVIEDSDEEDSGSDLIMRLMEYRRYKEASKLLDERASEWLERYPRLSSDRPVVKRDHSEDRIREVELWDLVSALSRIVRMPDIEREFTIRMDETPMSVFQEQIRDRIAAEGRVAFSTFFAGEKIQSRIVGIFLAILELIRHEHYCSEQPIDFGEIWIHAPRKNAAT